MQFADDGITIVRSDTNKNSKRRRLQARRKLIKEIEITRNWENKWKIKSNVNKMSIASFGACNQNLNKNNPIIIDGVQIPIRRNIKVLGYDLSVNKFSSSHCKNITRKASNQLFKLNRFKNAPSKVKSKLYKTLIRPLIEYPSIPIATTNKSNLSNLQKIRNRALRFIDGKTLADKIKASSLHEKYKIPAINTRLHKLARKCINSIINTYSPDIDKNPVPRYKYSNYQINIDPIKPRKRPVLQMINKYITNNKKCKLYKLNKDAHWPEPDSIYVYHN